MSFAVLSLAESAAEWDAALASLASHQRDVFFLSSWLRFWEQRGAGRAMGALSRDDAGVILYPFMLTDLAAVPHLGDEFAGLHDAVTPHGFGGPLVQHRASEDAVPEFRDAFAAWCRDNGVVSEFVRFHPLLDTRLAFDRHLEIEETGCVVWCRLDSGTCQVSDQMTATSRRNVRAAREAGLTCGIERSTEAYQRFSELYLDNAERRKALPHYRFGAEHYDALRTMLGASQVLFGVRHEGELIAGALFLRSHDFAHFHALAADRRYASLRPANLLFFEAMQWARGLGASAINLGGGYRGDDEFLRFKEGFAPMRAPRFVGHAIHLPEQYIAAARRRAEAAAIVDCDYFPAYRSPLPEQGLLG